MKKVVTKSPDLIQIMLIGILAIWLIIVAYLLQQAATSAVISLISWNSLIAFFYGFMSLALIVVAILVADIRKEVTK